MAGAWDAREPPGGTSTEAALTARQWALRETEAHFRELADNISQLAWTADQSGWIYWYNQRWLDYTGTTLEEVQGWDWRKVHHPDHVDRVIVRIRYSFETGTPWEDTFPLRGRDGTYRWFLSRALPIRNEAGDVIRWFGTNTDITEQIEAKNTLREAEARFCELADNISQFAWIADQSGWIYWYNQRWLDYTGTTLEEVQGWDWKKVHHPDHIDRVIVRIRHSFETGTPWEDTFPLRGRDGTYRWFLSRALPIRNEAGDVIRWFGTNTDVTSQIEAEEALRKLNESLERRVEAETEQRLQLWNVSEDLLAVEDMEGRFLSVNPAWTVTLGWSEADLLGKTSQWVLHPDDWDRTRAETTNLGAGEKTERFESRFRHRDGSYRWISWKAVPERGRIYASGRDITDLKVAETQLLEGRRELARVARRTTLAAMTASIAHEVTQPLAAIAATGEAALLSLADSHPDLDEVRSGLERIIQEGDRAVEILDNIRAMFRKDSGEPVSLDLNDLLRDVLALARREIESHDIVVLCEFPEIVHVVGERVPLQQVFLNLILNAVDAMSSLEGPRRLSTRTRMEKPDAVLITVADEGTGLDPKNIERIFEAFFTTKAHGTGIGLSICRSIVAAHGGSIWATSGIPCGSVFHVRLPACRQ